VHMQVDQARLRLYERSKLRYYYAIVEFDSVKTATRVYTECDGLEFQLSSCKFDLRFVPDEQVSRQGLLHVTDVLVSRITFRKLLGIANLTASLYFSAHVL
jgi:hypothetical protein